MISTSTYIDANNKSAERAEPFLGEAVAPLMRTLSANDPWYAQIFAQIVAMSYGGGSLERDQIEIYETGGFNFGCTVDELSEVLTFGVRYPLEEQAQRMRSFFYTSTYMYHRDSAGENHVYALQTIEGWLAYMCLINGSTSIAMTDDDGKPGAFPKALPRDVTVAEWNEIAEIDGLSDQMSRKRLLIQMVGERIG